MKLLFLQWHSAGQTDLEEAFRHEGHELVCIPFSADEALYGNFSDFEKKMSHMLQEHKPDIVFTVNYYPAITRFCSKRKVRYVSWTYDYPYDWIYFPEIADPCNLVYLFDKEISVEFRNAGISTVRYLPMAVNTERLDTITKDCPITYEVSFVGKLYSGDEVFSERRSLLTDYTKGYLEALAVSQQKISGYNLIPEVMNETVLNEMCKVYPRYPIPGDLRTNEYFIAESVINPWITNRERVQLLEAVAKHYGMDFFTQSREFALPGLRNHGPVDYYKEMPQIFKQSRINLNISRRGMRSAVPLRCFDIMGSGGFLLSNFQSGFLDLFVPGEDFACYENQEDLLQKIGYYLAHEDERAAIARSGHDKVAADHTYRHRVREMLDF